jgi:hypothetical protein
MEYIPLVIANSIHIASNIPLLSISVFALFSLGIKDRRDHCGVAIIMFLGIASIAAALWRILEGEMTDAKRNGVVVGAMVMVLPIQLAYSLPAMRLLARSTFKGTEKREEKGSGKGSVPSVGDSWVRFRGDWDEEDTAVPVSRRSV